MLRKGTEQELAGLRASVFGGLPAADLKGLVADGRRQTVAGGRVLFTPDEPCRYVQIVLSGRMRLWRVTAAGQELVLRRCGPGEVLGQMSALEGAAHSVGATAEEDSRVLAIPARAFRKLLRRRPEVLLRLAAVLAGRVRALSDELESMKYDSIEARLGRLLLELVGEGRTLRLTHQQLAAQVGASRENVSRVLGRWRERGVLRLGRGVLQILEREGLRSV